MLRAVMEGVALALRSLRDALDSVPFDALYLVGGGAKSTVWPQIVADVLNCEVRVLADPDSAGARGAAIIAGRSLGWYGDYAPADFFAVAATFKPIARRVPVYDALYSIYKTLHPQLHDAFAALSDVRGRSS